MTYKSPLEVFSFDKVDKMTTDVRARGTVEWAKLKELPFGAISWTLRNQGGFPIFYALENDEVKKPTHFETLDPDVAVVQDTIPRFIYIANSETTVGNDTNIYLEVTVPEDEGERRKGEASAVRQLRDGLEIFRRMFPRLFGGR